MKNWVITESKFLAPSEVQQLRKTCQDRSELAVSRKQMQSVKDWMIVDLALSAGLRVAEIANLEVKHLAIGYSENSILVENGKGGKNRIVKINDSLKKHMKTFIEYQGNSAPCSPLLLTERGTKYTTRGLQKRFKACLTYARIDSTRYSIHSARHTFCTELYRVSKDIRLVQKQAGHSSLQTTQVYADVLNTEITLAMDNIYNNDV